MADFFDTSVDVLLGYRIRDNRIDTALERIVDYCRTYDPEAVSEAEKVLAKYPHSFKAVYSCASVILVYGSREHDPKLLRRSLELLEQSRTLLSQNDDPRISEATITGNLSLAWFLLGERSRSIDLLRKNNAGGMHSGSIGAMLSVYEDAPEEAAPFLSEALLSAASSLLTAVFGYVFLYRSRNDWQSAIDIICWATDILTGLKAEKGTDAMDMTLAEILILKAYVQQKTGDRAGSSQSLEKARTTALRFDSAPDYSLGTMRFAEQMDQSLAFDILGSTAAESIENLIGLLGDADLADMWEEAERYE